MRRRLLWTQRAERDLKLIERQRPIDARRIYLAVVQYAESSAGDVLKLKGHENQFRLRVGDWRVLFTFEEDGLVVLALRVLNRRDAYR